MNARFEWQFKQRSAEILANESLFFILIMEHFFSISVNKSGINHTDRPLYCQSTTIQSKVSVEVMNKER